MRPVLVLYATREGQTHRIAEHVAATLRARGLAADVRDVRTNPPEVLTPYSAAVVAASVHGGRHEPEMVRYVKSHRADLAHLPATFLSVSLTEAGVEDPKTSPEKRTESLRQVEEMIQRFLAETGWHPARVKPVAGALLYSQYGRLIRFVMKRIAHSAGAPTDTSSDYVYTDWAALDHLADDLAAELEQATQPLALH